MVVRKVAFAVIALSVVFFGVGFLGVASSTDNAGPWGGMLGASIVAFVAGFVVLKFAGQGMGRAEGPKSFAALDVGGWDRSKVEERPTVGARTWTRSWMNVYFWTGAGELYLGSLFLIAAAISGVAGAIEGGLLMFGILGGLGFIFLYCAYRTALKDRLHTTGLDGTAQVVSVRQTGIRLNNNPVSVLDLKIKVEGHPEYEVRHRETVPYMAVGMLTGGQTLHVKVNPKNPSDFVIEW